MTFVCLEQKLAVFFLLFAHYLVLENSDSSFILWLITEPRYIFGKCWTMPITACISELRNIFHLMLKLFVFHLISCNAVNVQVLAGTEIITLVFLLELQGFNALQFIYEIISVESLDIFVIFMGGYKLAYFIWEINVKQKSRSPARSSFLESNQGLKKKWKICPQYFLFSGEIFRRLPGKSK